MLWWVVVLGCAVYVGSIGVHYDPLDVLRELVDLTGIMADTTVTNIKPSLHLLVGGSRLHESPHIHTHWTTFLVS